MPDFEDYYQLLGISPKATHSEIEKAWIDKNWILRAVSSSGAPETAKKRAEEELQKVNNAHDILKDPSKRQAYDIQWHQIKDKPKPVVDPQTIRFDNVNPKEVKTGSFIIRNLGGPYNRINISNPNTWVKVVRWHLLNNTDELPLQVEIEAVSDDFSKNYTDQIKVNLDDEETYVRVELQTRPYYAPPSGTGAGTQTSGSGSGKRAQSSPLGKSKKRINRIKGLFVPAGVLIIVAIIVLVIVFTNNSKIQMLSPSSTPAVANPQSSLTPTTTRISSPPPTISSPIAAKPTSVTSIVNSPTPTSVTYMVGDEPVAICFDGANIWVANQQSNSVTKLRASDGSILGTFRAGNGPNGIFFDGTNIWVANTNSNSVTKLKVNDGTILGTYTFSDKIKPVSGSEPYGICFDNTNIWAVDPGNDSVTKLRPGDGTILGTYTVGTLPIGICFDGTNIWVANYMSNSVTKLKPNDGTILGTYKVGNAPEHICSDGTNIWVANWGSKNVTKLRASDGNVLGTYSLGDPVDICSDGTNIWVTTYYSDSRSGSVTKLRASDGSILGTYTASIPDANEVYKTPTGIYFDGANIWVANRYSDSVSKLIAAATLTPMTTPTPSTVGRIVNFPDQILQAAIRRAIKKPTGDIYQSDLMSLTQFGFDISDPNFQSISNIAGIQYCTSLKILGLPGGQISDISPLASLTNLTSIQFNFNQITDISALASLTKLYGISLSNNKISNISPLTFLTNLSGLDLNSNQISDISPLVANTGLSTGDLINLTNNPLSATSVNIYIPQLRNRGATVLYP